VSEKPLQMQSQKFTPSHFIKRIEPNKNLVVLGQHNERVFAELLHCMICVLSYVLYAAALQDKSGVENCTCARYVVCSFIHSLNKSDYSLRQTADTMTATRRIMHFCHLTTHTSAHHVHQLTLVGPLSREKESAPCLSG
jgi:hypothetical protein